MFKFTPLPKGGKFGDLISKFDKVLSGLFHRTCQSFGPTISHVLSVKEDNNVIHRAHQNASILVIQCLDN